MSLVDIVNKDDDNHSLYSSTNSDDDSDEFNYHTHRSCSRYASCNKKKHQHSSIDSTRSISLSNNFKLIKGEIRSIDNKPGHRQKYDGIKWRRICSNPNCSIYLNGGIYYKKWLCRKHYLLYISSDTLPASNELMTKDTGKIISTNKISKKSFAQQSKCHKRGDIMINSNGIRQKYNGKIWRPICNYNNCKCFIVARGYCHRHDMEIRNKNSEILSSLDDNPQQTSVSKSQITRSIPSSIEKPKRGDIQCIRQQWNGKKWYSLCHYYTQDCPRRSAGIKSANLCDIHYKEYLEKQNDQNLINKNDQILLSPTVKRKKSNSIIDQTKQIEQCIQTDVTYPLETNDLREGCFLIDDDANDEYQSESPQSMVCIKKEEENYLINKRKIAIDVNSLTMNCKLEITKLEF